MSPPQKKTGRDTRACILEVAVDLFSQKGYSGTSIRDIADSLGVTKAALYYHFTSKDDVLAAVVAPVFGALDAYLVEAEAVATASQSTDGAQVLRDVVRLIAGTTPTLGSLMGDPEVLRSQAGRFNLHEKHVRLVRLITGPDADDAAVIRGHAALGAALAALEVLWAGAGSRDADVVRAELERHLATVEAAAIGALLSAATTPADRESPARR